MKKSMKIRLLCLVFLFNCIAVASSASAEAYRRNSSEFFLIGQSVSGDTAKGLGVTLELDKTNSYGIGVGTNFSNYVDLNFDILFGKTDITGKANNVSITGDATVVSYDVNLDINILRERFTPVIGFGIGFMHFSGDFKGYPFSESDLSYNVGAGLRWDVSGKFFIKALYKNKWTTLQDTDNALQMKGIVFSTGFMF